MARTSAVGADATALGKSVRVGLNWVRVLALPSMSSQQLEESDEVMSDVDEVMWDRYEKKVEDSRSRAQITAVNKRNESIVLTLKSSFNEVEQSFRVPEVPTEEDDIVWLCNNVGVDPRYPSHLKDELVNVNEEGVIEIPENKTRYQKALSLLGTNVNSIYSIDFIRGLLINLFAPGAIALVTQLHEHERPTLWRDNEDYVIRLMFSVFLWVFLVTAGVTFVKMIESLALALV